MMYTVYCKIEGGIPLKVESFETLEDAKAGLDKGVEHMSKANVFTTKKFDEKTELYFQDGNRFATIYLSED